MQHHRGFASGTGRHKPIRKLAPFKVFKSTQAVSDANATWFCQWQTQIRTLAPFKVFKSTQAVSDSNAALSRFCQWQTQSDPDICKLIRTSLEVFGEVIFGVKKASLNMFWEHSPYWTIIASDWLRAELSCEWRKNKNEKWMTVSLGSSLASGGICLFVDLWEAQPCLGVPEWDSS